MNSEQQPAVSVIKPVSLALDRVETTLFKPFDMGKWFTIGFCAWLALLGQSGFNFNFNVPFGNQGQSEYPLSLDQIKDFFSEHSLLIILIACIAVLVGLAVMITLLWLNSRGQFMFLYCVAENKAEVKKPWHKFRKAANSLFLFKLVAGFIVFICLAISGAATFLIIFYLTRSDYQFDFVGIFGLVFLFLIMAPIVIAIGIFFKFTNDFIIPIMYLRFSSCTEAWRQFLQILSSRTGAFALYLLFQIVIAMVIGAIVMALILVTCCCAALFMSIPYIGTVLVLPLLIFKRAYSLYYFRQFSPDFDVFAIEEEDG